MDVTAVAFEEPQRPIGSRSKRHHFVFDRANQEPIHVAADATEDEHFDPKFTVHVSLAEGGPLDGFPIAETAGVLDYYVREALAAFRPFFAPDFPAPSSHDASPRGRTPLRAVRRHRHHRR